MLSERSLRLRLYPLKAGVLRLPEQRFAHMVFPATELWVQENPEVSVAWDSALANAYWDQAWSRMFSVKLAHTAYVAVPIAIPVPDFLKTPAQQRIHQTVEFIERSNLNNQQLEWQQLQRFALPINVDPLTTVSLNMHAPVIEVRHGSGEPWRFVHPASRVFVQPLPSFLPNQVLMGDFKVDAHFEDSLLATGDLAEWQWRISGAQMVEEDFIYALQGWLADQEKTAGIEWFSPTIKVDGSEALVTIPFRTESFGRVALPSWQLAFFNPATAKMERRVFAQQFLWSLPAAIFSLIWIVFALVALILLVVATVVAQEWHWRWQWSQRIQSAKNILILWQQLKTLAPFMHTPQNLAEFFAERCGKNLEHLQWIAVLNRELYAQKPLENVQDTEQFMQIKQPMIASFKALSWRKAIRRRITRWISTMTHRLFQWSWLNCWSKFFNRR